MNTRRLRLVRPKWALGTMLLVVGWSAVVVSLNVRPRFDTYIPTGEGIFPVVVRYGYPWCYASAFTIVNLDTPNPRRDLRSIDLAELHRYRYHSYWLLAGNTAIGLLAVAVLTFASKFLLRAIVAGLRAVLSKPPPRNDKGPERASESL